MDKLVTISLPEIIYDLYDDIAKKFGDITVEGIMSCILHAYAQQFVDEMMADENDCSFSPKIELYSRDKE